MGKFSDPRPEAVMDIECYRNYFLVAFKDEATGRRKKFELYNDRVADYDRRGIAKILRNFRIVTFNGNGYDMLMLPLSMRDDVTNSELKDASDRIIEGGMRPWAFRDYYGVSLPGFVDHIDLAEVSPGAPQRPSLKLYAGKMHSRVMWDLPIEPSAIIGDQERRELYSYVDNDLDVTSDLLNELRPQLRIREAASDRYNMDLRSKGDAQIAEAIIKWEVERRTGKRLYRPDILPGKFKFLAPPWVSYQTPYLREMFDRVRETDFLIRSDGYVRLPDALKAPIKFGGVSYQMGIGGLHSQEASQGFQASRGQIIVDRDVRGYYPNLILGSGRSPKQLGHHFRSVFKGFVDDRELAKAQIPLFKAQGEDALLKDAMDRSDSGKIMTNGTFGKTGSPYSPLYAPEMMIQTTLSGQLAILMAIERVVLAGLQVVSANTDGFVTVMPESRYDDFYALMFDWECETGLVTEEVGYRSLHSRDVNNYIAITTDGYAKTKGIFAPSGRGLPAASGLKKNPDADICSTAVINYLLDGKPIEETIDECGDVRQFIRIRREKGGAGYTSTVDEEFDDDYVGKAVRWYYAVDERGFFYSRVTQGRVAGTSGARPLMELPENNELPDDIDIDWYVREAYNRLYDIGVDCPDPSFKGRSGRTFAKRAGQKTVHVLDLSTGVAVCGAKRKDRRELWEEQDSVAEGERFCSKCRKADEL